MTAARGRWAPAGFILAVLAALVAYTLRDVLDPANVRLPGRDAGNLYVWEVYTRSVLAAGRLPHWNPYHFAGTPHLADPQTLVFYPPAMFLRWLPTMSFLAWMAALHLWVSGAGALFLGRVLGLRWPTAAAAALAVMLGGSVAAWLNNGHLLLIYGTAWLPWTLALAVVSVRRGGVLPHPALIVVLLLQFLAGYLQGSLYIAGAVCSYYVFSAAWPEEGSSRNTRARSLLQLGMVAALALGVAAFQLWPTARLVAEAGRSGGLPYHVAVEGGWSAGDLATFFFPFRSVEAAPPHRYLGDRLAYVGWVLTLLVPCAFADRARRRIVVFFAALGGLAILFALAESVPLFRLHHLMFPGLRVPGRILFVATLSIAMVGALGLERFVTLVNAREWRPLTAATAVSVLALVLAAISLTWVHDTGPVQPAHAWPWLPLGMLGGLAGIAAVARYHAAGAALGLAVLLVAADITAFAAGAVQTEPIESADTLRSWMGPPHPGRAVSLCDNRIGPGGMSLAGQASLDGPASLYLSDYADFAHVAKTGDVPSRVGSIYRIGSDGELPARRDLIDVANTTTIVSCAPLDTTGVTLVSRTPQLLTYRNERAWPRASWTCGAVPVPRADVARELVEGRYDNVGRLRRYSVNVRWAEDVTPDRRRALEARYHLLEGIHQQGGTWRYMYGDVSDSNGVALIQDPAVEDTEGIDRGTGAHLHRPSEWKHLSSEPQELLIGIDECAADGEVKVLVQDQPDGRVTLRVSAPVPGVVFLSEPYYPERRAFVDGASVATRKANLAFTAVPVPAGAHRVELRYVPRSFHLGLTVSGLTLIAWAGLSVRL
jgi:hypothetical protein